ncbi:MAG: DUF5715 family protein [Paludibacter sp.]|nr:DUF5715 family protein [Paludibacter sp.]
MTSTLFNRQKRLYLYIFIALTFIVLITIYLWPPKKQSVRILNKYVECDHVKNPTAPITPSKLLKDKNDLQLIHAMTNGLKKPFATNAEFDSTITKLTRNYTLVEVKDCRLYHLKQLKHSQPYLIPEAVDMLNEIAVRFQEKQKEKKLGNYCFFLTSLLRTEETQNKLSRRNGNAAEHSTHFYGTTVDISYKHFYNLDNDSIEPKWELIQALTQTLVEMREECKLLAVKERKQACFHITVVECMPMPEESTSKDSL